MCIRDRFQGGSTKSSGNAIAYSDFLARVNAGEVREVSIQGDKIFGASSSGVPFYSFIPKEDELANKFSVKGIKIKSTKNNTTKELKVDYDKAVEIISNIENYGNLFEKIIISTWKDEKISKKLSEYIKSKNNVEIYQFSKSDVPELPKLKVPSSWSKEMSSIMNVNNNLNQYTGCKLGLVKLENVDFVNDLDVSNFIKNSKSLYQSKGTEESFRILFNVLYNETPKIVDLEEYLVKPSSAQYIRREIVLAEALSGNPTNLLGQTLIKSTDINTRAPIAASVSEIEPLTRKGKTYYKLGLFVGFNDRDLIEGTFTIPGITKSITNVSAGASVITVDSTVGFGTTGFVVSGTVSYTHLRAHET